VIAQDERYREERVAAERLRHHRRMSPWP
jgi:hypothetical protein